MLRRGYDAKTANGLGGYRARCTASGADAEDHEEDNEGMQELPDRLPGLEPPEVRTAQDVVATVVDHFRRKGVPLAPKYVGILASHSKKLLDAGFDYGTVCVAAVMAVRRGRPGLLQDFAQELVVATAGERMTMQEMQRRLDDEAELGRAR